MDMNLLKKIGVPVGCAAVGAIIAQVCIHWLPTTVTLVVAAAFGYIGWLLQKKGIIK